MLSADSTMALKIRYTHEGWPLTHVSSISRSELPRAQTAVARARSRIAVSAHLKGRDWG